MSDGYAATGTKIDQYLTIITLYERKRCYCMGCITTRLEVNIIEHPYSKDEKYETIERRASAELATPDIRRGCQHAHSAA
jgi:hypothetical protein